MKKLPQISIIIPTYNRANDVVENIESILESTYKNLEILVVDNASTDNTVKIIKKRFPSVKVIQNKENLEAAGGRNTGIKNADKNSKYLLFLDSDFVVAPEAIFELYKAIAARDEYGAATAKILYFENQKMVQIAGSSVGLYTGLNYSNHGLDNLKFDIPADSFAGGALFIKKEVAKKVGRFDEVYPRPYEDADYSVRIFKSGYKILYVPTSRIYHKASLDSKVSEKRWLAGAYKTARNKIIFMKKHSPLFPLFLLFYPVYIAVYACKAVRAGDINALFNFYRGIRDGLSWALNFKRE